MTDIKQRARELLHGWRAEAPNRDERFDDIGATVKADVLHRCADELEAALQEAQPQGVPEKYVLVPIEDVIRIIQCQPEASLQDWRNSINRLREATLDAAQESSHGKG